MEAAYRECECECECSPNVVMSSLCNRPHCHFVSPISNRNYDDGQYAYNPGFITPPNVRGLPSLFDHTSNLWSPVIPIRQSQHPFFGQGFDEYNQNITLQDAESILAVMAADEVQETAHGMMADEAELVEQRRLANQYVPESKASYDMQLSNLSSLISNRGQW